MYNCRFVYDMGGQDLWIQKC